MQLFSQQNSSNWNFWEREFIYFSLFDLCGKISLWKSCTNLYSHHRECLFFCNFVPVSADLESEIWIRENVSWDENTFTLKTTNIYKTPPTPRRRLHAFVKRNVTEFSQLCQRAIRNEPRIKRAVSDIEILKGSHKPHAFGATESPRTSLWGRGRLEQRLKNTHTKIQQQLHYSSGEQSSRQKHQSVNKERIKTREKGSFCELWQVSVVEPEAMSSSGSSEGSLNIPSKKRNKSLKAC